MRNHRLIYSLTLSVWLLLVLGDLGLYLFRAYKSLPTDEVYANSVGFQLLAFGFARFIYWVAGVFLILLVEFFIFHRRSRGLVRQDDLSP